MVFSGTLIKGSFGEQTGAVMLQPSEITTDSIENAKHTISGVLNIPMDMLRFKVMPFSWCEYSSVH